MQQEENKLIIGIAIGVIAALVIGAIAFSAGKKSSTPPRVMPQPAALTDTSVPTPSNTDTPPATNTTTNTSTTPSGQIKLSGSFGIYADGLMPSTLCFKTATSGPGIPAKTYFCFSNQAVAMKALKVNDAGKLGGVACDYISGKAEITISDFAKPTIGGDSPSGAKLVSVNKITLPASCARGTLNL